jgi:DNA polymerase III subunit gamma/tau
VVDVGFRIKARGEGDLKTRYRPQRLSEICPTFHLKDAQAILTDPNASSVWLFEGLTGCGKTTLARVVARAAVCECEDPDTEKPCLECIPCRTMESSFDFLEINGADVRGIDAMREITGGMRTYPSVLLRKIYIFDEAQQITPQAQELLNKVLEEPAEGTMIFLCTTNKKGLKRTLLGRCSKINFRRITKRQCGTLITQVFKDAKQEIPDKDTVEDLFRRANGSVRDLLVLLDVYLRGTYKAGSDYAEDDISVGSPDIFKLVEGYIKKDWNTVRQILSTENVKNDPDGYRETVCAFLARDALKFPELKVSIASALGALGGSLWEEPKREQHSLFVLRSMRACLRKG